jgi:hypothetical protein
MKTNTTKSTSETMSTKQAATYLNLSRVRVLGLGKQGRLVSHKGKIAGTEIPQVLFDAESVRNYVPSRSGGTRAMIVKLPADAMGELEQICQDRGWTLKIKNAKHADAVDANWDADVEDEDDEIELDDVQANAIEELVAA